MGKRSQAKQTWLTGSQRASRGTAKSGARLWGSTDGTPITRKGIEAYQAAKRAEAQAERARQTAAGTRAQRLGIAKEEADGDRVRSHQGEPTTARKDAREPAKTGADQ